MEGNIPYVTNLVNSIIGVSVLAMPFCMKQCGIVLGLGLLLCSAWLTYLSCSMLATSAFHKRRRTYEYLALCTLGPTGKFVVELSMIGMMLGTCVAFYVVIGDLSNGILTKFIDGADPHTLRTFTIVFAALCIALPLGMMKNLAVLSYFGFVSLMFYLAFLVVVVLNAISNGLLRWEWWYEVNMWRPIGIFQCLPIFSLAYACQCQLFIVYNSLEDPHIRRIEEIVSSAIKFVTLVYMSVGFFGYTTYREHIAGNLLVSFPSNLLLDFIKLGFALSVVLGFPLMISPCRQSIHTLFFAQPAGEGLPPNTYIPPFLFKSITLTIVISTMIIATVIPNVETILGLTGATMGSIICFIFPALIYEKAMPKAAGSIPKFVFVLGCMLLVVCTYSNLANTGQTIEPDHPLVPVPDPKVPEIDLHDVENGMADKVEQDSVEVVGNKPPDPDAKEEQPKMAEVVDGNEHRHEPANPIEPDNPAINTGDERGQEPVVDNLVIEPHRKPEDVQAAKDSDVDEEKQDSPREEVHVQPPVVPKQQDGEEKEHPPVQKNDVLPKSPVQKEVVARAVPGDRDAPAKKPDSDEVVKIPGEQVQDAAREELQDSRKVSPKIIKRDELPPRQENLQPVQPDPRVQAAGGPAPGRNAEKDTQNAANENADDKVMHDELIEKIKLQHDKQQQLLKEQEQLIKKLEEHQDKKEQAPAEGEVGRPPAGEIHQAAQQEQEQHQLDREPRQIGDNLKVVAPRADAVGEKKGFDPKIEIPQEKVAVVDGVLHGRELLSDHGGNGGASAAPNAQKSQNEDLQQEAAQGMAREPHLGAMPQKVVAQQDEWREVEKNIENFLNEHRAARKERDVSEQHEEMEDSRENDAVVENGEEKPDELEDSKVKVEKEIGKGEGKDLEPGIEDGEEGRGLLQDSPQERESQLEGGKDAVEKDMEECLASDVECWQAKTQSRELKSVDIGREF